MILRGIACIESAYIRLSIEVSKAQNDIPSAKRDGHSMARDVRDSIQLDEKTSSTRAISTLRQETLLNELEKALEEDEDRIVAKFESLRCECAILCFPANVSDQSREIESQRHRRCIGIA